MIRNEKGKWVIYSEDGKVLGTYDTEEEAKKRLAQIEQHKHMDKHAEIASLCLFEHEPGRDVYDEAALDKVVANFSGEGAQGLIRTAKGHELNNPVVVGHGEDQSFLRDSGLPAAGWISKIWREGKRLMGAATRVPQEVAELIKNGAYRHHSAEFYRDYEGLGPALRRLAILGGEIPARKTLGELSVQTYAEEGRTIDVFSAHAEATKTEETMTLEELQKANEALAAEIKATREALVKAEASLKGTVSADQFAEMGKKVDALKALSDERGKKVKELETRNVETSIDAWAERIQREKNIYNAETVKYLKACGMAYATDMFAEGKTALSTFTEAIEKLVGKTVEPGVSTVRGLPKDADDAGLKREYDAFAETLGSDAERAKFSFEWFKKNCG